MAGARTVWLLLVGVVQVKFNAGQGKRQKSCTFEGGLSQKSERSFPTFIVVRQRNAGAVERCGFAALET